MAPAGTTRAPGTLGGLQGWPGTRPWNPSSTCTGPLSTTSSQSARRHSAQKVERARERRKPTVRDARKMLRCVGDALRWRELDPVARHVLEGLLREAGRLHHLSLIPMEALHFIPSSASSPPSPTVAQQVLGFHMHTLPYLTLPHPSEIRW
ncbi:hypothetical protein G7046_g9726 [Stylonectria norvegica]|nr:hypothetical protein G7046_g9726 [Stylonectria norvegica]